MSAISSLSKWTFIYSTHGSQAAIDYAIEKKEKWLILYEIIHNVELKYSLEKKHQIFIQDFKDYINNKVQKINLKLLTGVTPFAFKQQKIDFYDKNKKYYFFKKRLDELSLYFLKHELQKIKNEIEYSFKKRSLRVNPEIKRISEWDPLKILNIHLLHNMDITGKGIVVGVIENSYPFLHPDIQWNLLSEGKEFYNAEKNNLDGNHATHVCGIIAGKDPKGAAPDCNLALFPSDKNPTFSIRIFNFSGHWNNHLLKPEDLTLTCENQVHYLNELLKDDKLLFQAIGNGVNHCGVIISENEKAHVNYHYMDNESLAKHIVLVGNMSGIHEDEIFISPSSNCPGKYHEHFVLAPGSNIKSTVKTDGKFTYEYNSGTSMATAFVSSIALLLLEAFPKINAIQLKESILESATPILFLNGRAKLITKESFSSLDEETKTKSKIHFGYGLVNALAAYRYAKGFFPLRKRKRDLKTHVTH